MEEGKLKRKKISAETTVEILFFLFLLVFYLMWARVQPMGAGPDEQMRYQIADYIYKHGSLPVGDDPSVRCMGNFLCIFSDSVLYDRSCFYESSKLCDDSTVCVASRSQICKHSVWTWNSLAGT